MVGAIGRDYSLYVTGPGSVASSSCAPALARNSRLEHNHHIPLIITSFAIEHTWREYCPVPPASELHESPSIIICDSRALSKRRSSLGPADEAGRWVQEMATLSTGRHLSAIMPITGDNFGGCLVFR